MISCQPSFIDILVTDQLYVRAAVGTTPVLLRAARPVER